MNCDYVEEFICMGLPGCVVDSVYGSLKVYHDHKYYGLKVSFNKLGDRFIPKFNVCFLEIMITCSMTQINNIDL